MTRTIMRLHNYPDFINENESSQDLNQIDYHVWDPMLDKYWIQTATPKNLRQSVKRSWLYWRLQQTRPSLHSKKDWRKTVVNFKSDFNQSLHHTHVDFDICIVHLTHVICTFDTCGLFLSHQSCSKNHNVKCKNRAQQARKLAT